MQVLFIYFFQSNFANSYKDVCQTFPNNFATRKQFFRTRKTCSDKIKKLRSLKLLANVFANFGMYTLANLSRSVRFGHFGRILRKDPFPVSGKQLRVFTKAANVALWTGFVLVRFSSQMIAERLPNVQQMLASTHLVAGEFRAKFLCNKNNYLNCRQRFCEHLWP